MPKLKKLYKNDRVHGLGPYIRRLLTEQYIVPAGTYTFTVDTVSVSSNALVPADISLGEESSPVAIYLSVPDVLTVIIPGSTSHIFASNEDNGFWSGNSNESYRIGDILGAQITFSSDVDSKALYEFMKAHTDFNGEEPTTYELSGTWVFNETLTDPDHLDNSASFYSYEFPFTSNDTKYDELLIYNHSWGGWWYIAFGKPTEPSDNAYAYETLGGFDKVGWQNESYRTITFDGTQTVSQEFYKWFTVNASPMVTFTIRGAEYQAVSGMTWNEWVADTTYNTGGFYTTSEWDYIFFPGGDSVCLGTTRVKKNEQIIADGLYGNGSMSILTIVNIDDNTIKTFTIPEGYTFNHLIAPSDITGDSITDAGAIGFGSIYVAYNGFPLFHEKGLATLVKLINVASNGIFYYTTNLNGGSN